MLRPPPPATSAPPRWLRARTWLLGLAGLVALLGVAGAAKHVAVRRRIQRINDHGGFVYSCSGFILPQHLFRQLVPRRLEEHFVLRDEYRVAYGPLLSGCGGPGWFGMHPATQDNPGDEGLIAVRGLGRVTDLVLIDTKVTDTELRHVGALSSLEVLHLSSTPIDGSGLAHIRGLRRLRYLGLANTKVDDAALEALSDLRDLEWLDLDGTRVRGPGLAHLARLGKLRTIHLQDAPVDDSVVEHLMRMPVLEDVYLRGTKVTAERIRRAPGRRWGADIL